MTTKTWSRRLDQLIDQIKDHPHKAEIIRLAEAQLADDFEQPKPAHLYL